MAVLSDTSNIVSTSLLVMEGWWCKYSTINSFRRSFCWCCDLWRSASVSCRLYMMIKMTTAARKKAKYSIL